MATPVWKTRLEALQAAGLTKAQAQVVKGILDDCRAFGSQMLSAKVTIWADEMTWADLNDYNQDGWCDTLDHRVGDCTPDCVGHPDYPHIVTVERHDDVEEDDNPTHPNGWVATCPCGWYGSLRDGFDYAYDDGDEHLAAPFD